MTTATPQPVLDVRPEVPSLSVVIPAFNEGERIGPTLRRVREFFREREVHGEIVVADDGSIDNTAAIVEKIAANEPGVEIRVVRLGRNRGKGAALRAGVAATRGARVLVMDADLATPIEDIDSLSPALDHGAPIAIGSRAVGTANVTRSQPSLRVLLGTAGNLWIRLLAVPGVSDTQCGFKLFDGEIGRKLFRMTHQDRFAIDIEVLCLARRLDYSVAEVGVHWAHQDGSKVRWADYLHVFLTVPRIAWRALGVAATDMKI
jgi:glycosyltransferase involved in cell wall biosynthesis